MKILSLFNNKQETKHGMPIWFCANQLHQRNRDNAELYTDNQHTFSNTLFETASRVYIRSKVYKNYRKKFIAIKIDKPSLLDKCSVTAVMFDNYCQESGIEKTTTKAGAFIYRMNLAMMEQVTIDGLLKIAK